MTGEHGLSLLEYKFKGKLTVQARNDDEAAMLVFKAFWSVGVKDAPISIAFEKILPDNKYRLFVHCEFKVISNSFEKFDSELLTAIKAITTEYHYDPVVKEHRLTPKEPQP